MKIGVVGLGRMGRHMARRLLDAGHDVLVFNRTAAKAAELVAAGARAAGSLAEACDGRAAVVTMLADDAALDAVALGADGLREHLAPGAIHVAMGTHGVDAIRRVAAAHGQARQRFVAAPVLGRPEAAEAGQLGIVAAGAGDAVGECAPLFEAMGRRVFAAGEDPAGSCAIKLSNNFVLGCAIEAMAEAFSLVRRYGVPANVLHEVLTQGLFASVAYQTYGRIMADESWDRVGFSTLLGLKDVKLMLAAGEAARVPLPSASNLRDRLLGAIAHGDGEKDWAVLAREQARMSGIE